MGNRTPVYTALKNYAQVNNLRLHMPGHIGRGIEARELKQVAGIDVTEVPGLDDLHLSREVIKESQQLLARACGAQESFFLVNGATSGLHALFMALSSEGEKVLVPRNAHRSLYGGMVLSGAWPVYIPAQVDAELGIALSVTPEAVQDLLLLNQEAGAVFITSPSYYGTTCHIEELSAITRAFDKILAVDEAHGAHFPFNKYFPAPALKEGADAVVNGLHKTWPVLNQGACLHLAESMLNNERLIMACDLLLTTSPSYPILASIDLARDFMEEHGESFLDRSWELSVEYRAKINRLNGVKCYFEELMEFSGVKEVDPLKVLIVVKDTGLTGYQAANILREHYQIQVEMEDQYFILAMFSMFHKREDWERFYQALANIARDYHASPTPIRIEVPPYPEVVLSPREAFGARKKRVRISNCVDMIAGEMIAAYPPGIPCLLPGELITKPVGDYLQYLKRTGARLQGPEDNSLTYIKV
ncbi:MAG: aminotransferase class I/II-fold pyridoxal phosphate-dependent enzyme, partial [Syntrophomonadaceae bacterium]|nr:aminotransferase class I/II-fold pyridoxal phosphate-dependent enzyme [Syntrophomonadaceae bacterium]